MQVEILGLSFINPSVTFALLEVWRNKSPLAESKTTKMPQNTHDRLSKILI